MSRPALVPPPLPLFVSLKAQLIALPFSAAFFAKRLMDRVARSARALQPRPEARKDTAQRARSSSSLELSLPSLPTSLPPSKRKSSDLRPTTPVARDPSPTVRLGPKPPEG